MNLLYSYPSVIPGKLIRRYKRFLADIELDNGEVITAHCANTGSMQGLCKPGSAVLLSKSDNPKRKLAYSWEAILVENTVEDAAKNTIGNTWVGINTALPNRVIKIALEQNLLPQLKGRYETVRSEVPYGQDRKSRIDFLLSKPGQPDIYLEVKNVTLAEAKTALFPDAVTTRGQKHLRELMALIPDCQAMMLYFINRGDCDRFAPSDACDPEYAKLLYQAVAAGVEVLPLRFSVMPEGVSYVGQAEFVES